MICDRVASLLTGATTALSAWESFYVIVGSSGGALIGLQFVVITLIAERRRRTHGGALGAFGTPTVVHLAGALVASAVMSGPWPSTRLLSTALFVGGVLGLIYGAIVFVRPHRQTGYEPVWEDWIWYVARTALARPDRSGWTTTCSPHCSAGPYVLR